ncbi:MAG: TolC family protein [Planctomycetota bacterium]|nr:TolC family protein [Planctomycetota bacterium]
MALPMPGCASAEPRGSLPLQTVPAFSRSGDGPPPDRWWRAFHDEPLNDNIRLALSDNFTLIAAWERLQEARAIMRRERSGLFPQLDGTADGELREGSDVDDETRLGLGLGASYEVDLWGRIESAVDAERLRAAATAADYRTAAISLSAEVALTWYEFAIARLQLELIRSQLETNLTVLTVLEKRFAVGQSGSADVLRQRQLVESTREQMVVARSRIEVLEHRLAVLVGRPPQEAMDLPDPALPRVPGMPATGLPAELLQRRPDVLSAFRRLEAADKDVAVAVTDQYPRIDLAASWSTTAENPSGLFTTWLTSLAGQVTAPLFDAGRRRAEVERTVAVRRRRLAEYGQTVLDAFREVEDALAQEAHQVRRIRSLEDQLALAGRTYRQLRWQYLNGVTDFIDVLTALREQQQIERDLLTARLDRIAFRIALHRALAGGFETPREAPDVKEGRGEDEPDEREAARG